MSPPERRDGCILVVGVAGSVAQTVAEAYLARGRQVAFAAIDGSETHGPRPGLVQLEGSDRSAVAATDLVEDARKALGGLDVVVRHRPARAVAPMMEQDGQAWADAVEAALTGAYHLSRAAARAMPDGGAIVHVLGPDATHAYPQRSAEAAAQAGIIGLVRALSIELASHDVRVNAVIAGPLEDDLPDALEASTRERLLLRAPTARLGRAAEVADAVRFVSDGRSSFMTGQTLRVDGGWASLNQAPDGLRFP